MSKRKHKKINKMSRSKEREFITIEYYQMALQFIYKTFEHELKEAYNQRPTSKVKQLISSKFGTAYPIQVEWQKMFELLSEIEQEMSCILQKRSVVFWLHLYRRIPPQGKTENPVTISLVRDIVESAIQKHGSLVLSELAFSDEIAAKDILGGWFIKVLKDELIDDYKVQAAINYILTRKQLVIVDFDVSDLSAIYEVEALAFEYWAATAKLRAIGKGAKVGLIRGAEFEYDDETTPWELMDSFDRRALSNSRFDGSSLGIWLGSDVSKSDHHTTITFAPNVGNADLRPVFKKLGLDLVTVGPGQVFNYMPHTFNAMRFCVGHECIAESFSRTRGYSLQTLAIVFGCLSEHIVTPLQERHSTRHSMKRSFGVGLLNLCRRAYSLKSRAIYESVKGAAVGRVSSECHLSEREAIDQVERIFEALTLSESNRSIIGIWSRGPRFPLVTVPGGYIFDFYGIHRYFHNLFVGIPESNNLRGLAFEEAFRSYLCQCGFILQKREFTFKDGSNAEADAVFYVGDILIVVDCISIWMPLDFDISRPKTMCRRQEALAEKVEICLNRVNKLNTNRVGTNFDFSAASEIVAVVASPFTEWLWDRSDRLWLDANTPRIMRANELVDWAIALRSGVMEFKNVEVVRR